MESISSESLDFSKIHIDLDYLLKKTLELSENFQAKELLDVQRGCLQEPHIYPLAILFKLESETNSFYISGKLGENISTHDLEQSEYVGWNVFPISRKEHFQVLDELFLNKRFPLNEETVFNISDPSKNWSMVLGQFKMGEHKLEETGNKVFQIFCRSHNSKITSQNKEQSSSEFEKDDTFQSDVQETIHPLGPLGDLQILKRRLLDMFSLIQNLLMQSGFHFDERNQYVKISEHEVSVEFPNHFHSMYPLFVNIFQFGRFMPSGWDQAIQSMISHNATLNLSQKMMLDNLKIYFEELALSRSFWLETMKSLHQEDNLKNNLKGV